MRRMFKIAAAAAGVIGLVLVPTVSANAEPDTDPPTVFVMEIPEMSESLDEYAPSLTQSELDNDPDFNAYLQQELQYQQTVETEPTVVSPDSEGSGGISARTTNPTPTTHPGVGALYFTGVVFSGRACTANYIGGKFWITADHCVNKAPGAPGFIQQAVGQFAGIEKIYRLDQPNVDLALIKVGSGMNATPFSLSTRTPDSTDTLNLVGYSGHGDTTHNFPSQSTFNYSGHVNTITMSDSSVWNDLTRLYAADYPACKGDSGGAYFSNGTMYGVHSGQGMTTENGRYNCGNYAYMANLTASIPWVQDIMATKSQSSIAEIAHAWVGGTGAMLSLRDYGYAPNSGYVGS